LPAGSAFSLITIFTTILETVRGRSDIPTKEVLFWFIRLTMTAR
jgi:hypothetical protein